MAPTAVRMVLVEGENGDGATVDEDNFDIVADEDTAPVSAADRVISAILGTREGAAEGGYQLTSTGVTWTDPTEAAALRDALAAHKVENVMLVSSFLAAAALAQAVGNATNYAHTALLFIEPDTATLAVVDTADGSIVDVERRALPEDDNAAVAELTTIVSGAEALDTRPDGVFVVGSGIDIPLIKPTLDAATALPVSAPEEPEMALARGAALASANAPLFVSSTAARAYAQDPGTGAVLPYAVAHGYYDVPAGADAADALAYSAVPDDFADAYTASRTAATGTVGADYPERRSFTLIGSALAAIFIVGVAALVVSLAITIRPTAGVRPDPGHNIVAPTQQPAVAPAPAAVPAPAPAAAPAPAPAPAPQAPAPVPVPQEAPAPAAVPVPQAPAPIPDVPAPAPVPVPAAPAPAPPPVAPMPPVPVPVPIPLPIFGGPPGGGHYGGGGPGGGGFPGFPGGGGHGGFGGGFGGGHGGGGHR
ncbi:MAG: hypothetical protein ACLP9N_22950 [Mycobacterium sp.]